METKKKIRQRFLSRAMRKFRRWKETLKKKNSPVKKGDEVIFGENNTGIVVDIGSDYIVVRDENYNTYQLRKKSIKRRTDGS